MPPHNFTDHYLHGSGLRDYFRWMPDGQWARVIEERRERAGTLAGDAAALGEIEAFNRAAGNENEAVRQNLARLADPQMLVVMTGQQAGLLLSPLYIIYKAIGALQLAAQIEREHGVPVVPVFWIASDDHDLAEVAAVRWIGKDGALQSFTLDTGVHPAGTPVYAVRVGREAGSALLDQMRATTHDTEFKATWLGWLDAELERDPTLEDLFARLMARLFGERGLVLLAPRLPALRRLFAPVLRRDIEQPGALSQIVIKTGQRLESAGYEAALHRREGDCNFFVECEGLRRKVQGEGERFQILDAGSGEISETRLKNEMLTMIENEPERFSPNVVSRPLAQDTVFSTLAYVAGPGEIAYHAQLREAYHDTDTFQPVIWPRPRVALIEPRLRRSAEKAQVRLEKFHTRTLDEWRDHVLAQSPGHIVMEHFDQRRRQIEIELAELDTALGNLSKSVADALRKTRETIGFALDRLGERVKGDLTQDDALIQHLEKIEQGLRPLGQPQERVLNPVCPFLFNYDVGLMEKLMTGIDVSHFEIQNIGL